MQVLFANLRILYQNRGLWFFYGFIGFLVCFTGFLQGAVHGHPAVLFVVFAGGVLPTSAIVAWTQLDVMARLLTFRLPNHQIAVRRLIFLVGVVISLAVSLVLPGAGIVSERTMLVRCSLFLASLLVFLTGVWIILVTVGAGMVIVLASILLVFLGPLWGLHTPVEHVIVHSPGVIAVLAVLGAAGLWHSLGRPPWWWRAPVKSRAFRPAGGPSPETSKEDATASMLTPREDWITRLLLARMVGSKQASASKYIWAALYRCSLPGGGGRRQIVAIAAESLVIAVLAWYAPCAGPAFFVLMAIGRLEERGLPLYLNVPFAGGRRERFLASMVLLILLSSFWTLSIAVAFSTMNRLGPHLPWADAGIRQVGSEGVPMALGLAVFLTAMFPISSLLNVVFHSYPAGSTAAKMIVFLPLAFWSVCVQWQMAMPLAYAAGAILASWIVCACGVYDTAMHFDLVSNKRGTVDLSATEIRDVIKQLRGGRKK
jgi:hypothetical protein